MVVIKSQNQWIPATKIFFKIYIFKHFNKQATYFQMTILTSKMKWCKINSIFWILRVLKIFNHHLPNRDMTLFCSDMKWSFLRSWIFTNRLPHCTSRINISCSFWKLSINQNYLNCNIFWCFTSFSEDFLYFFF